jgi:lysophospholipase L1-like esterase
MLGAIGDSYTQARAVSPAYLYDHPQFSWVVGTAADDGVSSILERLRALGGSPIVVDAAKSGTKMADAPRQARIVAAAAKQLKPGQTAYVTFELATNDLCDDPKPDLSAFELDLRDALTTLKAALPAGSRILMFGLPDFSHFRDITQASAAARASLAAPPSNRCAPFLGDYTPLTMGQAKNYMALFNGIMAKACGELATDAATTGKLFCTWNLAKLSMKDFVLADLSTADYFHPSLSGQAKMAAAAWAADVWSGTPLPTPS